MAIIGTPPDEFGIACTGACDEPAALDLQHLASTPPTTRLAADVFVLPGKFTETRIIAALKQADAGVPVKDICRQVGISTATYYQWKSKYAGLKASELRRVKEIESENAKLKRMYADLALDNAAMKDLIAKKL
ncbi:transposase [Xanthomonas citri]|uniref:transposase n=1 Tax=Xanthomonas citri TaxID=346 RepID=UPI001F2A7732|nr:transposase [Xanthomonas citri]